MITEYTLFTTLAFHHLIVGGLLILLLSLLKFLFKSTAEMRSWILMTAFIISTLVPFSLFSSTTVLTNQIDANSDSEKVTSSFVEQSTLIENAEQGIESQALWHAPSEIVFQFSELLSLFMVIWFFGSVWRSITIVNSYIRTRNLIKLSKPLPKQAALNLTPNSPTEIYVSDLISSPMVVGLISTKIILPLNITEQLNNDQLAPIVLHELAHIQRNDIWFGHFQELIAVIFWWSPVIRLLNSKIHVDRELACDLRAVKQLTNSKQYAQSLVDCAKLMITQQRSVLAMSLFSQKKELSNRVSEVLKSKSVKTPSKFVILAVCLGLSVTTIKASQLFSPKISINDTKSDGRHYSLLPVSEGEQLINAVMNNNIAQIQQLQNDGVDIDIPAIGDGTALIIAVKENNATMVQALIDLGANVDQSSRGDGNPLIMAAMTNNLELAQLLINSGANVNAIVPRDETPLINASRRGYLSMAELLINSGADVNLSVRTGISDGSVLRSPLNMAPTTEIQNFLIENGALN